MSLTQEIDKLARLRAEGALTADEFAQAKAKLLAAPAMAAYPWRGVRRQSSRTMFGLPLWAIATGPDPQRGEFRGHARGIFALGDIATGWVACGGIARGVIAFGGLAVGVVSFGGGALGLLLAIGGGAVGGIAFGGAAIGLVAVGGGAVGYYALGGGAAGAHVISAMHEDPAAVEFFSRYLPWALKAIGR